MGIFKLCQVVCVSTHLQWDSHYFLICLWSWIVLEGDGCSELLGLATWLGMR